MSWASALEASPFDLQEVYGSRGTEPGIWKTSTKMLGKVWGLGADGREARLQAKSR